MAASRRADAPKPMRLREYGKKRVFQLTPEPRPGEPRPANLPPGYFMVHKHDARRLHYDLRLEIDGALASWAIPKGPSLDPKERRLAVQTEDHPLAYGAFEGRIPEGQYGAGDSIIWDRGTWRTDPPGREREMRDKGHITFVLDGEKLHGRWHLVRTRRAGAKDQWLFFKGKDEHARAGGELTVERPESVVTGRRVTRGPLKRGAIDARHPEPIALLVGVWPPMEPEPEPATARQVSGAGWVFDLATGGAGSERALAALSARHVSLQGLDGRDRAARAPEVARALSRLHAAEAVFDGELVPGDGGAQFHAFDLLWLDGEDLRPRPLEERHELLESLFAYADPPLSVAERRAGPLSRLRTRAPLTAKRRGSAYASGPSPDWRTVTRPRSGSGRPRPRGRRRRAAPRRA